MIAIKRIYEPPASDDGYRVLVDRLWPRGLKREHAELDAWLKDLAPSDDLRKWFGHDEGRWDEFARRYREELRSPDMEALLADLAARARQGRVTLLFATKDEARNNAAVLQDVLSGR